MLQKFASFPGKSVANFGIGALEQDSEGPASDVIRGRNRFRIRSCSIQKT